MDNQEPETFAVTLSRRDSGQSWGFRLQGGVDFSTALSVQVVQPKSVAERCGLKPGDGILSINNSNTDTMTHEQAKMEIIRSCNDIHLVIQRGVLLRGKSKGKVQIWRPKVTPMSELRPQELQPIQTATGDEVYTSQKTSLARDHQDEPSNIGTGYNRSARPFPGGGGSAPQQQQQPQYQPPSQQPQYQPPSQQQQQQQYQPPPQQQQQQYQPPPQKQQQYQPPPQQQQQFQPPPQQQQQYQPPQYRQPEEPTSPKEAVPNVVHAQFNSPIGLYSAGNIAKSYSQQTAGIQRQISEVDVQDSPVGTRMTGTYQTLDQDGPGQPYGVNYGSPTSPQGDSITTEANNNDPKPESPKSLPNESEVSPTNEHAPTQSSCLNIQLEAPGGGAGFRSVSAPVAKPPGQQGAPKQESMHCNGCGNMVSGVFVRIKGMPYHEKCFICTNCGVHLKQKGYFMIEGKLYCEVHARRVAEAPGDNMKYAGAVYR